MSDTWPASLGSRGATRGGGLVRSFGDPVAELAASVDGSVLADLSHLGLLAITGEEARAFLQGQLSCDVDALGSDSSTLGAYCSPKGRMLASFLLWTDGPGFRMALARGLVPAIEKRLRMYVLRSKVVVADRTGEHALLGVAGPEAGAALAAAIGVSPSGPYRVARSQAVTAIGLPGGRCLVAVDLSEGPRLWDALARTLRPVGTPCWEWLDIRSGIPLITPATQDALVPQMANFDLIGGVSFQKGCYPGQEVVARMQYLGKANRRMFLARIDGAAAPAAGDDLYSEDLGDQACGTIVNAAPSPEGGYDALAVVPAASAAQSIVHLRSLGGPPLRFRALPYAVP